jgi:hypothetical protein
MALAMISAFGRGGAGAGAGASPGNASTNPRGGGMDCADESGEEEGGSAII